MKQLFIHKRITQRFFYGSIHIMRSNACAYAYQLLSRLQNGGSQIFPISLILAFWDSTQTSAY
jgi:hypothetical protein